MPSTAMSKLLQAIETYGNKIPHPSLMFFWLCVFMVVASAFFDVIGTSALHPITKEVIDSKSLISAEGLRFMLTSMVKNFMGFAPLGVVLVAMLGIGIAEKSGLLNSLLHSIVDRAKGKLLTFIIAFAGVMSSLAADSGYVILIPISALLFIMAGRPPMAGIATAFAAVSGGYSANLLIGPIDAVLAGLSTEAAQIVQADYEVNASANWWFNIFSTFFIATLVTIITEKIKWKPFQVEQQIALNVDTQTTQSSFKGIIPFTLTYIVCLLCLTVPEGAVLRHPETGSLTKSPFVSSIVVLITIYFACAGIIFGKVNNTFKNAEDVIKSLEDTMSTMAGYLVLMFFAAQFLAYFNWSNLGLISAVNGANFLSQLSMPTYLLLACFIIVSGLINLFIGSSSAQWALMAPIFVPMLMLVGIEPEITQIAYRIGDSSTNIITPMMPYFALVLAFSQKYDKQVGMGTLIAAMLPYSVAFITLWSLALIAWIGIGIPLGF